MTQHPELEGRVAIVAGGGSAGMGRASARALAEAGAYLAVLDIDARKGRETVDRLVASGHRADFYQTDMTDPAAVEATMAAIATRRGRIDILFNNTGVPTEKGKRLTDFSPEEWARSLDLNLNTAFHGLRFALPHIIAGGRGGSIINNASASGLRANSTGAPYSTAKAGVIHLTKVAALEVARYGIRVNAICPYSVSRRDFDPPAADARPPIPDLSPDTDFGPWQRAQLPMMRSAKGYEIAAVVRFLASDAASWITGAAIPVDGGSTAGYFGEVRASLTR